PPGCERTGIYRAVPRQAPLAALRSCPLPGSRVPGPFRGVTLKLWHTDRALHSARIGVRLNLNLLRRQRKAFPALMSPSELAGGLRLVSDEDPSSALPTVFRSPSCGHAGFAVQ